MSTHSVSISLKKGGGLQTIANNQTDSTHELYVLIRNVGEGNADVSLSLQNAPKEITMEPHTARLVVPGKGNAIQAKCSSTDTYTVLLVDFRSSTPLESV